MGQHAEDIINGDVDQHTGEWLGDGQGFPRSETNWNKYKASTKAIRKELAIIIKGTIATNPHLNEDYLVNKCRQEINTKYGKGWREQF